MYIVYLTISWYAFIYKQMDLLDGKVTQDDLKEKLEKANLQRRKVIYVV